MTIITYIPPGADPESRYETVVLASKLIPNIDGLLSPSLRGLGGLEAELSTVKIAGQTGELVQKITLPARIISDTISIVASSRAELAEKRTRLMRMLNPLKGEGTLIIQTESGAYKISALPRKNGIDAGKIASRASKAEIEFFCPKTYFFSLYNEEMTIFQGAEGVAFPWEFPLTFPSDTVANTIYVSSQIELPVTVTINGPIRGFCLKVNDTEVSIPVNVREGEVFVLDGENQQAFLGSSEYPLGNDFAFPELKDGLNSANVGASYSSAQTKVTLSWASRHMGV